MPGKIDRRLGQSIIAPAKPLTPGDRLTANGKNPKTSKLPIAVSLSQLVQQP
jgi:hypothetical protein